MAFSLWLLVSGSTFFFVTGTGYPASALNDLSFSARLVGDFSLVGAVLQISLGLKAFRVGEKWAWFALWIIPLWGLLNSYFDYLWTGNPQTVSTGFLLFAGLTTIALLLSIRKFFTKQQAITP